MTVKDLAELHYLDALITRQQERLQELRDAADVKAQVITGMPNAKGAHDRIGEIVPKLADAEAELEAPETIEPTEPTEPSEQPWDPTMPILPTEPSPEPTEQPWDPTMPIVSPSPSPAP